MTEEETELYVRSIHRIIKDLPAPDAELVITEAYFEVITMIHINLLGRNKEWMMQHVSSAYDVWYDQVRPHIRSLNPGANTTKQ
jgi:hypothetical protein